MSSRNSYKNPPSLEKDKLYEQWKNEVKMWQLVTDLDKKKRGLALALSLQGKPREVALELDPDKLNADDGVNVLVTELDKLFEKDKIDQAYSSYNAFDKFQREDSMTMSEYMIEFEQKYNKCKKYEMVLPDAILAFKLLDNAGLSHCDRQLALTACTELKFDTMKSALNRIFGTKSPLSDSASGITVKEESAFWTQRSSNSKQKRKQTSNFKGERYNSNSSGKPRLNPTINGNISRCRICDSKYHWVRNCPHKQQDINFTDNQNELSETETVNITLYVAPQPELSPQTVFVTETLNTAVIDTACTKTVCGEKWFRHLFESLDDKSIKRITISDSKTPFKFGDGKTVYSEKLVKFPARIGNVDCFIETEVVNCEIPLLLSKDSLKRAQTVLDLNKDKVSMFGQPIDVQFTSSGHYCIKIVDVNSVNDTENDCEEILIVKTKFSKEKKREIVLKLHKQFGHASSEKLISLLKSAGSLDSEIKTIVNDICAKCIVCHKFKRPQAKPIVAFSHANDFNQIVAMDLHEIDHNLYYLHIIDLFSRLSAAAIVRKKDSQVIVDKFLQIWVGVYGAPEVGVFTDNGGEFNSQVFRDMAENLNMSVKTSAGYSPWSNGVVERHNATLTETLNKMRENSKLSWETAICWAVNAKNSLLNVHGFSPYQIVFGRNPNLPSAIVDKPPALEGETISKVMGRHLSGLHEARKAFISSESSEKVRRALRKQIRPSGERFNNGDKVYFLRENKWKGPGWVIGQDNVVVLVRYGGSYVRVHQSRIMRDIEKSGNTGKKVVRGRAPQQVPAVRQDNDRYQVLSKNYQEDDDSSSDEDEEGEYDTESVISESQGSSDNQDDQHGEESDNQLDDPGPVIEPVIEPVNHGEDVSATPSNIQRDERSSIQLHKNQTVNFKVDGEREAREAVVLGRAGKASTNKKNWYNIEYTKPDSMRGEQLSIDLGTVEDLQTVSDDEETEEVYVSDIDFKDAQISELKSWKRHNVYTEVEDAGQKCISTRWVYTVKEKGDNLQRKARLVAKGFEEDCLSEIQKNSPTCDKQSLRLILSIITQRKWNINSVDIKTAFLQGEKMQREVYLRPPKEANAANKIWKLNKCVYGLADASLKWYEKVKKTMLECGGKISKVDPAVFYWRDSNGLAGILAVHVDDFLWTGSKTFETSVVTKIRGIFSVGKEACDSFKYIGLDLSQENDKIVLSQKDYTNGLNIIAVDKNRDKSSPLSPKEQTVLRSKVGQLMWLARQTRPDIAFDVTQVASSLSSSTVEDTRKVNKIIRKVKAEQVCLNFHDLGKQVELVLFSDASFGNLTDGGSQGGYVIFLKGENGTMNPITWQSKKIRRVVRSTLASETLALADGVDCVLSIATLLNELLFDYSDVYLTPITCYIDNNDLYQALYSNKHVTERRLRIELNALKQMIQNGEIRNVHWIKTDDQVANVLTKQGASAQNILDVFKYGQTNIEH